MASNGFWLRLREIALTLAFVLVARTCVAAPFYVSSGSMQPTLLIGDHMIAEPFAYGFSTASLPFGNRLPHGARLWSRLPARGDVVVFRSPAGSAESWVKRVIGLPGDHVRLAGGRLFLNGERVPWSDRGTGIEEMEDGTGRPAARLEETLPGGVRHLILKSLVHGPADDMDDMLIPPGRLFVMGDNRDNSADSRYSVAEGGVGLLPIWALEGKVPLVTVSRDIDDRGSGVRAWLASGRTDRILQRIN